MGSFKKKEENKPMIFRLAAWISIFAVVTAVSLVIGQASVSAKANTDPGRPMDPKLAAALETIASKQAQRESAKIEAIKKNLSPLEKKWGIQLLGLHTTAAGYMLDFRFRVLDREKAYPLLERNIKRYIVVDKSNAVLRVPFTAKLGSMRASVRQPNMVKNNKIYASLFANPGQHVKAGDKVSLVIGHFIADHLEVQ